MEEMEWKSCSTGKGGPVNFSVTKFKFQNLARVFVLSLNSGWGARVYVTVTLWRDSFLSVPNLPHFLCL